MMTIENRIESERVYVCIQHEYDSILSLICHFVHAGVLKHHVTSIKQRKKNTPTHSADTKNDELHVCVHCFHTRNELQGGSNTFQHSTIETSDISAASADGRKYL